MAEEIEYIDHNGRITAINEEKRTVIVTLEEKASCGECPAWKLCSNFSSDENVVEVGVEHPEEYKVGEFVAVRGTERLHRKAILLITVIPTVAILVVMIGLYLLTRSQLTACVSALGAMIIFFLGLYLMRNKLAHEFVFEIIREKNIKENETIETNQDKE